MVKMAPVPSVLGFLRLSTLLIVAGMLTLSVRGPVRAQAYQDGDREERQQFRRPGQGPSASNLPEWAKPSSPHGSLEEETGSSVDGTMQTNQPTLPGDPEQVPVDGGLALLAAAGAGYAVRKLNEEEEEDDEPA